MASSRTVNLPLRSTDFDLYGHLNQAVYHQLFEDARVTVLRDAWQIAVPQIVLGRSEVDYRAEVPFGVEEVSVELWLEHIGRSSFTVGSNLRNGDSLAAEGSFVLVAWDGERRRSRPLSPDEREALEGFALAAVDD